MPLSHESLIHQVATELSLAPRQVAGALALFDAGNTLPFIARYRKEATGALNEVQLRDVHARAEYLRELEERRGAIIKSIDEQGKLTPELSTRISAALTKQAVEDLYLPYKPKRRTRATIARERGLEPLAEMIWTGTITDDQAAGAATEFVSDEGGVSTAADALQGARDILAERVAEDAGTRAWVRESTRAAGALRATATSGKEKEVSKFQDYYDFSEKLGTVPSHRVLAIRRGEAEGFLVWTIAAPVNEIVHRLAEQLARGRRAPAQVTLVAGDAYKRLIAPSIEVELRLELKARADDEAIAIFGMNLEQLLLAPPAGARAVIGLDPGFRTGVKVAALSRTGSVEATDAWYLHQPEKFAAALEQLCVRTGAELIAIGNGTASRETEMLVRAALAESGRSAAIPVVVVSEAGASVYSASDVARAELPELDVSIRGAVSIARRLQDPLAELVKIDPKSIGVGQYQHDVNQSRLKKRLDQTVESVVNRVGVEVNTASPSLLAYVAGVGPTLAQSIVRERDARGGFTARADLASVPRLGAKAFEQAAGFLRVRDGKNPLDATAVHSERYEIVERMAADAGLASAELLGNDAALDQLDLARYVTSDVGLPTLRDISGELRTPGRDPRRSFEPLKFRSDVSEPKHLREAMVLEGVVTNIVAFGAFVDIGVHQDGLVHVSQIADRFIRDPAEVVRVGDRVTVRVLSVDLERQRIALSMRSDAGHPRAPREGAALAPNAGQPARDRPVRPAPKPPAPFTATPGSIAPNGIRFK